MDNTHSLPSDESTAVPTEDSFNNFSFQSTSTEVYEEPPQDTPSSSKYSLASQDPPPAAVSTTTPNPPLPVSKVESDPIFPSGSASSASSMPSFSTTDPPIGSSAVELDTAILTLDLANIGGVVSGGTASGGTTSGGMASGGTSGTVSGGVASEGITSSCVASGGDGAGVQSIEHGVGRSESPPLRETLVDVLYGKTGREEEEEEPAMKQKQKRGKVSVMTALCFFPPDIFKHAVTVYIRTCFLSNPPS